MSPGACSVDSRHARAARELRAALLGLCLVLGLPLVAHSAHAQASTMESVSPGQLSPFARWFRPGSDDVIVSSEYRATRRQRGDWEPIDLLVMVHNPEWEPALRLMVEQARTRVPVEVLIPAQEHNTAEFRAWSKNRCIGVNDIKLDTPWIRDYGPLQVFDGLSVTWLDYAYYEDRRLDDSVPGDLATQFQVPLQSETLHVDGGGLVSNGRGLCAMTDTSLADAGMHLGTRKDLETFVGELGCHGLAILPSLPNEQTGHADVVVQFLAPDLAAVAEMDAQGSTSDAELLDMAVGSLRRAARAIDQPLRIMRVPMHASGTMYYSYLNALRVADLLFVPEYAEVDRELQARAHQQLQAALPKVTLVPVPADAMVSLGGAIHCIALGLNVRGAAVLPTCPMKPVTEPATLVRRRRGAPPRRAPL